MYYAKSAKYGTWPWSIVLVFMKMSFFVRCQIDMDDGLYNIMLHIYNMIQKVWNVHWEYKKLINQ